MRAVNQLLFGKFDVTFTVNASPWFHDSSRREGPTWTTASLIFYRRNLALSNPVDISNYLGLLFLLDGILLGGNRIEEFYDKFLSGIDSELVNSHFVSLGRIRVVSFYHGNILLKDDATICLFFRSPIRAKLTFPLLERISFSLSDAVECSESSNRDY